MSRNILYENVDMLDVMEACEDNSKDFIMLYMPTMDRAIEGLFCDKELEKGKNPEKTDMLWPENGDIFYHCYDELPERIDYGNAFYTNKADYDAYIDNFKGYTKRRKNPKWERGILLWRPQAYCFVRELPI